MKRNACQKCTFAVYDDNPHCGLRGFTDKFNVEWCSAKGDKIPNGYELQEDGYFSWIKKEIKNARNNNMEYKFNTKFKVEEIVYTLINKKITEVRVEKIEANVTITDCDKSIINIKYSIVKNDYTRKYFGYCPEEDLYRTKEELINNL